MWCEASIISTLQMKKCKTDRSNGLANFTVEGLGELGFAARGPAVELLLGTATPH